MVSSDWRVLVVEDQTDINELLATMCRFVFNCEVMQADSAQAAVEVARQSRPHLVLLDLKLDGSLESGFTEARSIRANRDTAPAFVIVISNHIWDRNNEQAALASGCDLCLDKHEVISNFKPVLSTAISTVISARAARDEEQPSA